MINFNQGVALFAVFWALWHTPFFYRFEFFVCSGHTMLGPTRVGVLLPGIIIYYYINGKIIRDRIRISGGDYRGCCGPQVVQAGGEPSLAPLLG
jgi:hypothetical protein